MFLTFLVVLAKKTLFDIFEKRVLFELKLLDFFSLFGIYCSCMA